MAVEEALADWPGALLLISHDRVFQDTLTHKRWEIRGSDLCIENDLDEGL